MRQENTDERDVDVYHMEYTPTGCPPLACDVCGKVFATYYPTFVGIYIPKGRESQAITLCQECEARILNYLGLGD